MQVNDLANATAATAEDIGRRFVGALAAADAAALLTLLADDIDFRGMTPGRVWDAHTSVALVGEVILGKWLEADDIVDRVESIETAMVSDRCRLGYRLQVTNPGGKFVLEQQAFFDIADGKITWLRMLCSGFRPVSDQP
jgi:hypothetical protein